MEDKLLENSDDGNEHIAVWMVKGDRGVVIYIYRYFDNSDFKSADTFRHAYRRQRSGDTSHDCVFLKTKCYCDGWIGQIGLWEKSSAYSPEMQDKIIYGKLQEIYNELK